MNAAEILVSLEKEFSPLKYLSGQQVQALLGISHSTAWRFAKAGKYPRPSYMGTFPKYSLCDVAEFMTSLSESDSAGPSKKCKRGRPVGSKNRPKEGTA